MKKLDKIDMEKNISDDKIKELLSGTKQKASDNLKYRIMQQIATEQTLAKTKKVKDSEPLFQGALPILGVIYAIIIAIGIGIYVTSGKEGVMSTSFYMPIIMIMSIASAYLAITFWDNKRREKHKH